MLDESYDIVVIGAGIIGLATALKLTQCHPDLKIAVLEKESQVGLHQTGHNSGVIHAGIYYAPGSHKANFCSVGGKLLREFCDQHEIKYEMCGKLIVAVDESEVARLEDLYERGTQNGAEGLRMIGREEIREIEPHAAGVRAIFSPNTGIIDYREVSEGYLADFKSNGGKIHLGTKLREIHQLNDGISLETNAGTYTAKNIINCAGLQADEVAIMMGAKSEVRIIPFRGEYFSIVPEKSHMVKGLIYPVPDPNLPFLGVHFTKRINGTVEAGPNAVFAWAKEGYTKTKIDFGDLKGALTYKGFWKMSGKYWKVGFNEQIRSVFKGKFVKSLQTLMPEISGNDLGAPGAGVRAQAVDAEGKLLQDFSISETHHAIHVLNAPSPGATSSLAISEYIASAADKTFELSTK